MSSTESSNDAAPAPASVKTLTTKEKRAMMRKMILAGVAQLPPLSDSLEELEIQIPVSDGWQSRTIIVRPKPHVKAKRPLIVHFYGGGMIVGEPEQLLSAARAFAEVYGAVVALPSYRLTPDVQWQPVPYKDGWDVVAWLSKHAPADLGADLDAGFIVGGISAGATVAAVCGGIAMFPDSKEAQEAPKLAKPLTGQFLCLPCVAVDEIVPAEYKALFTSREDNKDVAGLNTAALNQVLQGLHCTDYTSLWFSPVSSIVEREPSRKIPVYFEHCGLDPLRDDVTLYGRLLDARGIHTKTRLFTEDVHASWTVIDAPSKATDPTIEEAQMEGMKWLLATS